jgi:four helix bundle protein
MTPEELKARTTEFAVRVINLVEALPRRKATLHIGGQLLRAGTAVGSNYRAACRGRSHAEFTAKLSIALEEADESAYWLEVLSAANLMKAERLGPLHQEAEELVAILAASRKTARDPETS